VYNVGLVRQLCRDIYGTETDPQREQQLLFLLREVTTREVTEDVAEEDQDELRFRMAFLAETYLMAVRAEPIAWGSPAAIAA
jgi:hypothetical protein